MQPIGRATLLCVIIFACSLHSFPAISADLPLRREYERSTPFEKITGTYDVIVAGAGTGGTAAALQASRLGARVLLIEETDWIGGQMTAAGVSSMDEGYPPRDRLRERGIYGEFTARVLAFYRARGKSPDTMAVSEDHFAIEPHVAHRVLYDIIADTRGGITPTGKPAVIDVLLRSKVTAVQRTGKTVTGVTLQIHTNGKTVAKTIPCRVLVDATEYGDVIPLTGAAWRLGSWRSDGPRDPKEPPPIQDITWAAALRQYPGPVPEELRVTQPPPLYKESRIKGLLSNAGDGKSAKPWNWPRFVQYRGAPDSTSPLLARNGSDLIATRTHINLGANDEKMDALDVEDPARRKDAEYRALVSTLAVMYYGQQVMGITNWAVSNDEGYDSPYNREQAGALVKAHPELKPFAGVLPHMALIPYVRESRRIQGLYTLVARDMLRKAPNQPKRFPTALAIGDYPVDLHASPEDKGAVELDLDRPEDIPLRWIQFGYGPFQVPHESFIPIEVDGFVPAEKNISQSRIANGATRLQPSTMLTGQAAGAIAGLAAVRSVAPRAVPPLAVQDVLLNAGSTLSLTYYTDLPHGTAMWKNVQLATLYGVLDYPEPEFLPTREVKPDAIKKAAERLAALKLSHAKSGASLALPANFKPANRADLAKTVAQILLNAVE